MVAPVGIACSAIGLFTVTAATAALRIGTVRLCAIATRRPPRAAQSAAVPGDITNVPLLQSATALSDGGSADAGTTTFGGAGGMAVAGSFNGAEAGVAAALCAALGATRGGGGGGAICADARSALSKTSAAATAKPTIFIRVIMGSP